MLGHFGIWFTAFLFKFYIIIYSFKLFIMYNLKRFIIVEILRVFRKENEMIPFSK